MRHLVAISTQGWVANVMIFSNDNTSLVEKLSITASTLDMPNPNHFSLLVNF
jgi:hypothetical protein